MMSEERDLPRLVIVPPSSDIRAMLVFMNLARKIYRQARTGEVKRQADRQFNRCYDWFVRHEIPIRYDARSGQWQLDWHEPEPNTLYISLKKW
jgi:hypothetical protein